MPKAWSCTTFRHWAEKRCFHSATMKPQQRGGGSQSKENQEKIDIMKYKSFLLLHLCHFRLAADYQCEHERETVAVHMLNSVTKRSEI